jgi:hypothetical protein
MRNLQATMLAAALVLGLGGCGTKATGITVTIEPDPVQAFAQRDGTYVASWDAVVANLNEASGTIQSLEATLTGAAAVSGLNAGPTNPAEPAAGVAVDPFARRMFRQTAQFKPSSGQSPSVEVTVRFKSDDGQAFQATAQARITLR